MNRRNFMLMCGGLSVVLAAPVAITLLGAKPRHPKMHIRPGEILLFSRSRQSGPVVSIPANYWQGKPEGGDPFGEIIRAKHLAGRYPGVKPDVIAMNSETWFLLLNHPNIKARAISPECLPHRRRATIQEFSKLFGIPHIWIEDVGYRI